MSYELDCNTPLNVINGVIKVVFAAATGCIKYSVVGVFGSSEGFSMYQSGG